MEIHFLLENIEEAVQKVWQEGKAFKVWAFYGEMGAGKTTFITALCNVLQVQSSISSPTYSIINEYYSAAHQTIYHMDWYRLSGEEEAMQAGAEEALYSGNLCLVEWPEKAPALLPPDTLQIHLSVFNQNERMLLVQKP